LPARLKAGYDTFPMMRSRTTQLSFKTKLWRLPMWMLVCLIALMPLIAQASSSDDEGPVEDARLQGYPSVVFNQGGSGTTYMFFVVLTLITAGVMFMNAKRTHLD